MQRDSPQQIDVVLCRHLLQAGGDRGANNLLAVLTARHVLLLDLRRPAHPLLRWAHSLESAQPQMLSLFCHGAEPQSQVRAIPTRPCKTPCDLICSCQVL